MTSDLDYVDYARIARSLRGQVCPVCGRSWLCPKDVVDRKPIDHDGGIACASCAHGSDAVSSTNLGLCLSRSEDLSAAESNFVARVASVGETSLGMDEYRRLCRIAERLRAL